MNTASMDIVANKTKRLKRANKENIECLSEGIAPLKKIKAACAVGAEMVKKQRFLSLFMLYVLFAETNRCQRSAPGPN